MSYSAHVDSFARDNLPPKEQWPAFLFTRPELQYPARLNACTRFLDRWIAAGRGDAPCLVGPAETLTYGELDQRVNRIANVLTGKLGLVPGGRVLLRAANTPMWVAVFFAVLKAGGVVVATMPMLRAREIAYPLDKAKIGLALCDHRLSEELEKARPLAPGLARVVYWGGGGPDSLEALMADASPRFEAVETAADDVCLIAFTSGTTGEPKGTMHFHRDLVAICDAYSDHVLRPEPSDRFIGSPPLAFTFGLGALALFPMHAGAVDRADREGDPGRAPAGDRKAPRDRLRHRADRLSGDARPARRARRVVLAQMRLGRRGAAEGDLRGVAGRDRAQDHGRHRRDRDAAHLHRGARGRDPARRDGKAGAGLRGEDRRRGRARPAAGRRRAACGARADRLPLPRRRAPAEVRRGRLEPHRRHLPHG